MVKQELREDLFSEGSVLPGNKDAKLNENDAGYPVCDYCLSVLVGINCN